MFVFFKATVEQAEICDKFAIFQPNDAYNVSFKREINDLNNGVKTNQICEIHFALLHAKFGFEFF